ncbi:carboxypeptidase-like regulatory domain-containing protein [Hyunsoonleella pacifica]|uniref:Carboxypeptidase-like regulatory domain-containing protein n=1 Tax=Hyunsoonleella pacifica TaxID=1080224 RepID=A0A4Q9FNQ8_9FLAO|nr:carboxypeptidase-like regulatory domain-containing protein [Hyunsoonleella pacifica]TBN16309.1 carboxypeptidase-like regulatory domain-containing protein [Hyunsoonleella pacifica]GGD20536.1 hypothetical protein GCM10011368_23100 [Hyunsoonleella pacifica]
MKVKLYPLLFLLLGFSINSQTISGTVLDSKTKTPIETATVYFDNTSLGAITRSDGKFSIKYSDAIKSPLIISFLGYKKQVVTNYRNNNTLMILLEEDYESLGEVVVNANDGLTRKQKLRFFRREFLGLSRFGKSCTILNEDDIILSYNKKERVLTAHSKAPLRVKNNALQYNLTYDLNSFTLKFNPPTPNQGLFSVQRVGFLGNSYYQDFENFDKKKALKNRRKAYDGSKLQFMRALYIQKLKKYQIYSKNTPVDPWEYIHVEPKDNTEIKRVSLSQPLNILFKNWKKSSIEFETPSILIDYYGNYTEADKVLFAGKIAAQRVGDLLPFGYGL